MLQGVYQRGNSYQSVYLRLESIDSLQRLKDALTTDPRLNVTVVREPDYYAQQSQVLQTVIRTIGVGIAVLMGLGAVFGAVNTMYSAVAAAPARSPRCARSASARCRSSCRCWSRRVLLSLIGGALGGLVAWAGFDGYQTSTMNLQSFSQVAFAFAVTPALLVWGSATRRSWACSAACSRPSAPPACRSCRRCGSCKNDLQTGGVRPRLAPV